jgi:hypothetical protein
MPRQYAFAPGFGQPVIDKAQLAAERERRLAQTAQENLGLRREALADTGERFSVSEKRQQALADSTISNQRLTGQKTAFELKQAEAKAKREEMANGYFTLAQVLEASIEDPRAFDHNPDEAAFWRNKYPDLDKMTPEQKMQLATMRRRYGQDLIDGKGVEASVLRAGLQRDAATERERVQKELQAQRIEEAAKQKALDRDAAAMKKEAVITPLDHVTIRKALTDLHGRDPQADTIQAVADLVKNKGLSLQNAMQRVQVPLKGRDEAIMEPARAAFREASATGDEAEIAQAREGVAAALQRTDTPEDVAWDSESKTLVPRSALTPSPEPDISAERMANGAMGNAMQRRADATAAAVEAKRPATAEYKFNVYSGALKTGIHPVTGKPLEDSEKERIKVKLKELREEMLGSSGR